MTSHRPPILITAAAATVLGALYFVPNASATAEHATTRTTVQQSVTTGDADATQPQLADTGSVDTTPYVIGGAAFLGMGAALLVNAARRTREA